jgi:hypothetical protein
MLSDPQTLTITGATGSPFTLNRISTKDMESTYSSADGTVVLVVSHVVTKAGRVRTTLDWTWRKVVNDPITNAATDYDSVTIRTLRDRPSYGFSAAEIDAFVAGTEAWTTTAIETQLFGRQS